MSILIITSFTSSQSSGTLSYEFLFFTLGTHLKRSWCWERLRAGGEGDDREWDGWMASPTPWTWVWVDSGSWWWTGRPGWTCLNDWTLLKNNTHSVKNLPAMQGTWVLSLGLKDPLEKGMATQSSILAWEIPWTEEPGGLLSLGLQELDTT